MTKRPKYTLICVLLPVLGVLASLIHIGPAYAVEFGIFSSGGDHRAVARF